MKKIILVAISILFIPVVLFANEIVWLSPKGSDRSDGTKAAPLNLQLQILEMYRQRLLIPMTRELRVDWLSSALRT
ncbi:hypothetical protein [Sphingobacterium multivorum]|uniref:hypothetical protein n=1 Tax=Sphingobacterium multivorum TaxID=28454 RepID=UPI0028AB6336|nr:hypothetical protein [Sphingobacterium multivorum]